MKQSTINLIILIFILITVGALFQKYEDKNKNYELEEDYNIIQKYLLDEVTLEKSKKPILWIYVPYEYNSRNWLSFGSRSSFELNQPYLYLTVKSIIKKCSKSFTVCIIDDYAFKKLLPTWNINLLTVGEPIRGNLVNLGLMKLLYKYGGLLCPVSFLCMKDLNSIYEQGTQGDKMFLCETIDRNITSTDFNFYPNLSFSGSPKENMELGNLIDFIQRITSNDFTAQSKFLGDFDRWCESRIQSSKINLIDGKLIGTKNIYNQQIKIEELMGTNYLKIDRETYGILIPSKEILSRRKYEWFARLSETQIYESNVIIGNYLLLSAAPTKEQGFIEPYKNKPSWVAFWKTPLMDGLYGLKPDLLGDNLLKVKYPGR
jgi:hypothetical protein